MSVAASDPGDAEPVDQTLLSDRRSVKEVVEEQLQALVQTGGFHVNTRLPAERELAATLGVSRTTLRQALNSLEQANLVTRRRGRGGGTFLVPQDSAPEIGRYAGLSSWLREQGFETGTRLLSARMTVAGPAAAAPLAISEDDYVFSINRVRFVAGQPISAEHARIPVDSFPDLLQQPIADSIGEIMFSRYGKRPSRALEWHQAILAAPDQAEMIDVPVGSPLLAIDRITLDQDGQPIEFGQDLFRGDWARVIARVPITEDLATFRIDDADRPAVHMHSM